MIDLVALFGLGHRLRSIASAYTLAENEGHDLRVFWPINERGVNVAFESLFVPPGNVNVVNIQPTGPLMDRAKYFLLLEGRSHGVKTFKKLVRWPFYDEQLTTLETKNNFESVKKYVSKNNNIYVSTCYQLCNVSSSKYQELFTPVEEIQNKVKKNQGMIDERTIGIHIRRGDHERAKRRSPVSEFKRVIERELDLNPKAKFYLATDSMNLKEEFKKEFASSMITSSIHISRNTTNGIKDAMVDMFLLSKTSKIYASRLSSFSFVASEIGKVTLVRVTKNLSKSFLPMT